MGELDRKDRTIAEMEKVHKDKLYALDKKQMVDKDK